MRELIHRRRRPRCIRSVSLLPASFEETKFRSPQAVSESLKENGIANRSKSAAAFLARTRAGISRREIMHEAYGRAVGGIPCAQRKVDHGEENVGCRTPTLPGSQAPNADVERGRPTTSIFLFRRPSIVLDEECSSTRGALVMRDLFTMARTAFQISFETP